MDINVFLKIKVEGGGINISDMTIKQNDTTIWFTIKYKNKYGETHVCKIDFPFKYWRGKILTIK